MAPEARRKFRAPLLKSEVFQKQMWCIEESTGDIVGIIRHDPAVIRCPRNCTTPPLSP